MTQRVLTRPGLPERYDALDQQWAVALEKADILPVLLPNRLVNVSSYLRSLNVTGLLLTGGNDLSFLKTPDSAPERDQFEFSAVRWALEDRHPILGVCRGAQLLVHFFGGQLCQVTNHASTSHSLVVHRSSFGEIPPVVCSYHNFGFFKHDLPPSLELVATSEDGVVEAFRHSNLPIVGIMWHPEREMDRSGKSLSLLQNLFGSEE